MKDFNFRNKWILAGSLGAVFMFTLIFSYGPGYGGSLLAFLSSNVTSSPEVSPSDAVTPVVTVKKMVTLKSVTNVTSVLPTMSPSIYNYNNYGASIYSMSPTSSPRLSVSPSVSPRIQTMSPTPRVSPTVSPVTPTPSSEALAETTSPTVTPEPETPTPTPSPSPIPTPILFSPQSTKININIADKTELMTLKGIKDAKSDAIIQYRESHGLFEKIEDIMDVSGIGPVTFDGIKDQITVGP